MRNLSDQWDALATWFALTNHQTYASTQLYIITRVITFWGHVQVVICKYQRQRHSHAFLQAAAKLPVIGETPKCKETQDKQAVLSRKKHTQYCCGACAFRFPGRLSLDMRQDCRRTYRGLGTHTSESCTKRALGCFCIAGFSWGHQVSERTWGLLCSLEIKCLLHKRTWEPDPRGFLGWSMGVVWNSFIFIAILGKMKLSEKIQDYRERWLLYQLWLSLAIEGEASCVHSPHPSFLKGELHKQWSTT